MISNILKKAQINNKQRNKMRSSGEKVTANNYYANRTKAVTGFGMQLILCFQKFLPKKYQCIDLKKKFNCETETPINNTGGLD